MSACAVHFQRWKMRQVYCKRQARRVDAVAASCMTVMTCDMLAAVLGGKPFLPGLLRTVNGERHFGRGGKHQPHRTKLVRDAPSVAWGGRIDGC
eukprot:360919-Chlamydomonas_euryale.AAC.2